MALLQAQKMEAMGQLTGGVAHDFNNLLTAVSGSLALLEPHISSERAVRLLRVAQRGASRGAKLTKSLLAFARKQRLDPVPADLNSVVVEISEMLRRSIGASVEVPRFLVSDLWPVLVDVSQIGTALLNVALNARDAMPEGGVLVIETANIRARDKELPAEVAGHDCVLVSLRDTGMGMTPEVIERAFEPFFTTKEIGKGTGLGLSMVFGVVRQSGGAVRIRSHLPRRNYCADLPAANDRGQGARSAPGCQAPDRRESLHSCRRRRSRCPLDHLRGSPRNRLPRYGPDSGRAALAILERGGPCDLMIADGGYKRGHPIFLLPCCHQLGPFFARLREWVLEGQGFAEPSGVKVGSFFFHLGYANKHLGDHQCERSDASQPPGFLSVPQVPCATGSLQPIRANEVQLRSRRRGSLFFSVEFPNDQEAEAFAGRFDRKEPPGLTPLGG